MKKNQFDFWAERSYIVDILEEHIYSTNLYFVPSYDHKPTNLKQFKFESLPVFLFKKRHE